MPSVSGLSELDTAIGLAFLFFLLATACSALNELLASALGWRAKTLEDGIRSMLGDPAIQHGFRDWLKSLTGRVLAATRQAPAESKPAAKASDLTSLLFQHWRIKALVRNPDSRVRRRRRPSYLPPRALSRAVAEQLAAFAPSAPGGKDAPSPWQLADADLFAKVQAGIKELGEVSPPLQKAAANASLRAAGQLETFRASIEDWFDDTMDRASGWYKRKVQVVLVILAAALAIGLNVNAVHVGSRLWKEPALRAAVAARASAATQSANAPPGTAATAPQQTTARQAADAVDQVEQLNLPVGWGASNRPKDLLGVLGSIPGWIITIAALSLGAPFWFDLLSRLARLRGSGGTDAPRGLSDRKAGTQARR